MRLDTRPADIGKKRIWGYIGAEGVFRPLPRWLGVEQVPPSDVTLPSGEVRRIIWAPEPVATQNPPSG